jgi:hypothetical protein
MTALDSRISATASTNPISRSQTAVPRDDVDDKSHRVHLAFEFAPGTITPMLMYPLAARHPRVATLGLKMGVIGEK